MTQPSATSGPSGTALPTVALDLPSAQLLADYASVLQDLRYVQECCKRLLKVLAEPENQRDGIVLKALWSAALVAYARCFASGKRFGLSNENVQALPLEGEVSEFHQWLINMRNKHVAHSVNPFEIVKVGAVLSAPDAPQMQVEGIATLSMEYMLPDETGVRQLGGLAAALANQVAQRGQAQQEIVLNETRQLNVEELSSLPPLRTYAPDTEAAGRARAKGD